MSREIITQSVNDKQFPGLFEIIFLQLSADLPGPGSTLPADDLPSRATFPNYHLALALTVSNCIDSYATVFPIPTYSSRDQVSGLRSTDWLLSQPDDFQRIHVPLPFDATPSLENAPPHFPTPPVVGELKIEGWNSTKPCWVHVVPQEVKLTDVTFKRFNPSIHLKLYQGLRLLKYSKLVMPPYLQKRLIRPPRISVAPLPSNGATGALNSSTLDPSFNHRTEETSMARGSAILEALWVPEAVKKSYKIAFLWTDLDSIDLESKSESSSSISNSDDESSSFWDPHAEIDIISYARYFPNDAHLTKMVEDHDREVHARFERDIRGWAQGVAESDSLEVDAHSDGVDYNGLESYDSAGSDNLEELDQERSL